MEQMPIFKNEKFRDVIDKGFSKPDDDEENFLFGHNEDPDALKTKLDERFFKSFVLGKSNDMNDGAKKKHTREKN
ncbi:MAG: hypothetical protein ABH832_01780 [bacterium]